jgi:phosphoglycolate phosphatase
MGNLRRLIAFDLDGTLIDSRKDLAASANQLLAELGARPLPEDQIGRMVGEGARVLVERALAASGLGAAALGDVPGALARFLEIYDTRLLDHTRAYDGIPDAVRLASDHASIAVLTNKPLKPTEQILDGLGLRNLFDVVVGGDGPFPRKPDPAGLMAVMERAGASPDRTLMVGDSVIDHETARRASVKCCLTSYGFGFGSFPVDRLDGTEWIAGNVAALSDVITRFGQDEGSERAQKRE